MRKRGINKVATTGLCVLGTSKKSHLERGAKGISPEEHACLNLVPCQFFFWFFFFVVLVFVGC